jgi:hypothetical protein
VTHYHPRQPYPPHGAVRERRNGMGTTALVLGIVALALSWVPIVGVLCFVFGLLGLIFGSIGIARAGRGLADNMSSSIAGVVTSVLAIVVRLAIYTAMAVSAQSGTAPVSPLAAPGAGAPAAPHQGRTEFRAGESGATGGWVVTVNALQPQRESPSRPPLLCSTVTLSNTSGEERPFIGGADWKIDDPQRVLHAPTPVGDNVLGFGMLPPGGEVSGNICFEDPGLSGTYVIIYDNRGPDSTPLSWTVSR